MAKRRDVIVMHHPALPGRTITARSGKQAAVFSKSGWQVVIEPEAKSGSGKEKSNG